MVRVELISPPERAELASEISQALLCEGFEVLGVQGYANEPVALTIGILEPENSKVYFEIGHRLGAARPVLLIAGQSSSLPEKMNQALWVSLGIADTIEVIVAKVREILGIELASHETTADLQGLVSWLSHDWQRLYNMDSRSFERLVMFLFEDAGFKIEIDYSLGKADIMVKAPDANVNWLVACRPSAANQPLGLGAIRDAHALCDAHDASFAYIVSNSYFTRAAVDCASRLVPALHLVDCEQIKNAVVSVAGKSSGGEGAAPLLPAFLRKANEVSRASKSGSRRLSRLNEARCSLSGVVEDEKWVSLKRRFPFDVCFVMSDSFSGKMKEEIEGLTHRFGDRGAKTITLMPGSSRLIGQTSGQVRHVF